MMKKQIEKLLKTAPAYSTEGQGDNVVCKAHFFNPLGKGDWYVLEAFKEDNQIVFFGYVDLIYPELGYFSLNELMVNNMEMDLWWNPKSLREIKEAI